MISIVVLFQQLALIRYGLILAVPTKAGISLRIFPIRSCNDIIKKTLCTSNLTFTLVGNNIIGNVFAILHQNSKNVVEKLILLERIV